MEKDTVGAMMNGMGTISDEEVRNNNETPEQKQEREKKESEVKDDEGKKAFNVQETPEYKALLKKSEDLSTNLSGQNKIISKLTKEMETLKATKPSDVSTDVPFPKIKWSKDLTKAERDDMTDNEIAQLDTIATMQDTINKMSAKKVEDAAESGKDNDTDDGKGDDKKTEAGKVELFGDESPIVDLGKEAKNLAFELAGKDTAMANLIITEFNQFAGNDSLNATQLKERMEKAAKLVPTYKAPKEQVTHHGAPVKKDGDKKEDPFGVDSIVETVSRKSGGYSL